MSTDFDLTNIMSNFATRIGNVEGTLKTFMDNWARQDQLAHESRRLMYERIEMIGKQVERVATDIQSVQQDVAEMRLEIEEDITPTIESVERNQERKIGAKGVWALIIGGVASGITVLAVIADKVLSHFIAKP